MVRTSDLAATVSGFLSNPARTQRVMGKLIKEISGGEAIIFDPSSPVANVIEAAAQLTAAAVDEARTLDRKRYALAASGQEDILRHMSDGDYIGVYSTPATGTFKIAFDLNALYNAAVPESGNTEVRKVIIPRNSYITNGVHTFTLQYPVVIRLYPNRNIQIMYDGTIDSPIESLAATYIHSDIITQANDSGLTKYLVFELSLKQLQVTTRATQISSMGGFNQNYNIPAEQKFHYCRVYIKNAGEATFREIHVTHNNEIYDPAQPTALIAVTETTINVSIPLIYTVNNMVNNTVRIDLFTCAGRLDYLQGGFSDNVFNLTIDDLDKVAVDQPYISALDKLSGTRVIGVGAVAGGSDGIGFEELRERYVNRANGRGDLAITPAQVRDKMIRNGYDLALSIDNISNREFLATRALPNYIEGYGLDQESLLTVTGLGMTIGLVQFNLNALEASRGIADNGDRMTILPDCLFVREEGKLRVASNMMVDRLLDRNLTPLEELVSLVNRDRYLYSPFHYRIGITLTRMYADAFQLNRPYVVSKRAIQVNSRSMIAASTTTYDVGYNPANDGYTLRMRLQPDSNMKALGHENVNMQISFTGDEGGGRHYINGTLITPIVEGVPAEDSWVYDFQIKSNMDLNINKRLIIHDNKIAIDLEKEFDIIVTIRNYVPSGADSAIMNTYYRATLFPDYSPANIYMAITHEKINIHFGDALDRLWLRHRTMPEETEYRVYDADVYAFYEKDVIEYENGIPKLTWDAAEGTWVTTILHHQGEIQYDDDGEPIVKHAQGTFMKDEYGNPIPVGGVRGVVRQLEMLLVDGKYFFANDEISRSYYDAAVTTLGSWIIHELPTLARKLMDESRLRYYPKDTLSTIAVTADDGVEARLEATQYVAVDYYMSEDRFNNVELKDSIKITTPKVVNAAIAKQTVSIQDIEEALRSALGDSVISVRVGGIFGGHYNTVTIEENTSVFTLDKRLDIQSNMSLAVVDNIDVRFHNHSKPVR